MNSTASKAANKPSSVCNSLQNTPLPAVLHVVLSLDCGGLEHVVLMLCRRSLASGGRVGVVCLETKGDLAPQLETMGVALFCLNKQPGIELSLRRRLAALFDEWRPDIIHTHQIGALFYAGPAACKVRKIGGERPRVVHSEHGKHYEAGPKLRLLARYATWHCDRYVGVAEDVRRHAIAHRIVSRQKTEVVPNGVDVDRFCEATGGPQVRQSLGIGPDCPVIGSVGRLAAVKNYALLLQAFAAVRRALPNSHLLLVGDGPERVRLAELADKLDVSSAVHLVGFQDKRENYLQAMDVFCLTSDSEGLPLSLLEAMAANVPVVGSQVGGIPGVIESMRNGLLFEPGDSAAAAEAIEMLITNTDLAKQCATNAHRDLVDHFSSDAMADAYTTHYQKVLERR